MFGTAAEYIFTVEIFLGVYAVKRILALIAALLITGIVCVSADGSISDEDFADTTDIGDSISTGATDVDLAIEAKSCLLMEAATGTVLYEENAQELLPPASVTKIMSLLLIMEAIDSGKISFDDVVQCSANAAGKGGSQVYLEEGEQMTVSELLKSIVVASGNDATVCMAEYVAGSEEAFVIMMNEKAALLGMKNTTFVNCTGLDDEDTNMTTAYDIALMSRELLKHEKIFDYTTIWMDTIRDGAFGLANTNKLVRFYSGTNGLKTGSTSKAKFCISATAKRENMQLIAVIMASDTGAIRNEQAKKLLDYGFANYAIAQFSKETDIGQIPVLKGTEPSITPVMEEENVTLLCDKGKQTEVEKSIELVADCKAPVEQGQKLGEIKYKIDGEVVYTVNLVADKQIARVSFGFLLKSSILQILL